MANINIQMKSKNGAAWDNLYPLTKGANVTTNDGHTLEEHVSDTSKHIQSVGNITEATSSILTITGAVGSVLGSGVTIAVKQANSTTPGFVTPTDWNTFNNKQAALGFTPLNKAGDTMTGLLTLSGDPVNDMHAVTKRYVDSLAQGLDTKASVRVASTVNIPTSAATATTLTLSPAVTSIDGITLAVGNRILVKNQTDSSQNGIYVYTSSTVLTRSSDADNNTKVTSGMFTYVEVGTSNSDSGWALSTDEAITLGTTDLEFVQFSGAGQITAGTGLTKNGNTLSLGTSGVAAGTYRSVTVDIYGRVTAGTNPTTIVGYGITDAVSSSDVVTSATANKILKLDASGLLPASVTGNSATATKLATARTIAIGGGATGTATSFDGTANITINVTTLDATKLSGTGAISISGNAATATKLATTRAISLSGGVTGTATNFDGSADIDIVVTSVDATKLSGTATINTTGNSATATKLATARTLSFTGDATGTGSFDGSVNLATALTLATTGVTAGVYRSVTVDAKGRVTAGSNPTTLAGYGITDAAPFSHVGATGAAHGLATTTVAGFFAPADKVKLDQISTYANRIVVSATDPTVALADFWYAIV